MSPLSVRLLRLRNVPILQQLNLEEALLRATASNWMLINDGNDQRAVVMGISGKPRELLHVPAVHQERVPVIKRFSGGGTVVVDPDTLFVTFIMQAEHLPHVQPYPVPIMQWSEGFYSPVFSPHGQFALREHDYVFGGRKFGGNAQAITGRRWCHHTSLLWDYQPSNMALLTNPAKQPQYRQNRDHRDFLVPLRELVPSRQQLLADIVAAAGDAFDLQEASLEEASQALGGNYLRANKVLDLAQHL